MRLVTLGYQDLPLEEYVRALKAQNVGTVIDVRETPWSFKRGFSKAPLRNALKRAGISYVHVKSAGNPSINRKTSRTSAECLSKYRAHLRKNPECLKELKLLIEEADAKGQPACLTCYERMPSNCHRSILVEALCKNIADLEVTHVWQSADYPLDVSERSLPVRV
jgi:uncharacterized protein (DUF488 family)